MHYVYILKSSKDGRLYIGHTSNLRLRFKQHLDGKVEATKHRRPLELIYYEAYAKEIVAKERELKLKQFGSAYKGLVKRLHLE